MATKKENKRKKVELFLTVVTSCLVLATVWAVLVTPRVALAHNTGEKHAHSKKKGDGNGNGKTGKVGGDVSGWIFCRVTFDDFGGVQSDGSGEYLDGVDRTKMRIGRNRSILMDLNTHNKKDSIRTLYFPGGIPLPLPLPLPAGDACLPVLVNSELTPPVGLPPEIQLAAKDAKLVIKGEDHDDTPIGCCRAVNAALTVKDDNGETWIIHFGGNTSAGGSLRAPCGDDVIVERLPNVDSDGDGEPDNPGFSQWMFSTTGLGYVYRDNNPPHSATEFWGMVSLPFSGIIESLTDELEPEGLCADLSDSVDCP